MTLVLTAIVRYGDWGAPYALLTFALYDSIDGSHWAAIEDTTGQFVNKISHQGAGEAHQTARYVVPFAGHLRMAVWGSTSTGTNVREAAFESVRAKLLVRRI